MTIFARLCMIIQKQIIKRSRVMYTNSNTTEGNQTYSYVIGYGLLFCDASKINFKLWKNVL